MKSRERDISGGIDIVGSQVEGAKMLLYSVLAWFTITIEAFLRHNFGERYYTKPNFFVGLWLLVGLSISGAVFAAMFTFNLGIVKSDQSGIVYGMSQVILAYVLVSLYHFWRIWVNNQSGYPEHSLSGGDPHLLFLGKLVAKVLNPPLTIAARTFGKVTLSKWTYDRLDASLKIKPPIQDPHKITRLWIEPIVVILISQFVPGIVGFWLVISGSSLFLYAHLANQADRAEELNITDDFVEAAYMKYGSGVDKDMRSKVEQLVNVVKERAENEPEYIETLKEENPSVFEALEDLDIDLGTEADS